MTFGEKLASLRKQANLTQNDLADKLNVSRQAITKWENGVGLPDIDNLTKIASLFNTTIDELIDYKVESVKFENDTTTEIIDKENSKFKNVDNFILNKFIDAEHIERLTREVKLNFWQGVFDFFIGAGTLEVADGLKTGLVYPYLITKNGNDYLALVCKDKLMTKKLSKQFIEKSIVIDGYKYTKPKNNILK